MEKSLEYMTAEEAAAIWRVSTDQVLHTCERGGIKGAAKLSGHWIIPVGTPCPNYEVVSACTEKAISKLKRTEKQQLFIDSFSENSIPFAILEHRIGKRTMTIVCRCSDRAKQTLSEAVYGMFLDDLDEKGVFKTSVAEREKILRTIRVGLVGEEPSLKEYMEKLKVALASMDFCEDDISMLLEKYAEHYRPLIEK